MAANYDARLDQLETAQGIGVPHILVVMPGEDIAVKLAEFRRIRELSADEPVRVMRVKSVASPFASQI